MSIKQIIDGCWTFSDGEKVCYPYPADTGGIIPTGDINITENGEYNVTEYANAIVNVSGGGSEEEITITDYLMRTPTAYEDNSLVIMGDYAFYGYATLKSVSFPNLETIGGWGFCNCEALADVYLPKANFCSANAFSGCKSLQTIDLPSYTTGGVYTFNGCSALVDVNLPLFKEIGSSCFKNCSILKRLDLPSATSIGSEAFRNCTRLGILILRNETMVTLSATSAFSATPIKSGGKGYIYVPSALIDSYKVATNWSTYASQFRALEAYTVDGTITGELDESKI